MKNILKISRTATLPELHILCLICVIMCQGLTYTSSMINGEGSYFERLFTWFGKNWFLDSILWNV